MFVCLLPHFQGGIRLSYSTTENVHKPSEVQHELIRQVLLRTGVSDVEMATIADLPGRGLGLGSSAATTVGALLACVEHKQRRWTPDALARAASAVEIEDLGRAVGYQDQWAVAYGGLAVYEFRPNGEITVDRPRVSARTRRELESWCALYWLECTRDADGILQHQSRGVRATQSYLSQLAQLAEDGAVTLEAGNLSEFCGFMREAWEAKKALADGISNPEIDALCRKAERAGAAAWKVCGAGGGGSLLVMRPPKRAAAVSAALVGCRAIPFRFEPEGAHVVYNGGWRLPPTRSRGGRTYPRWRPDLARDLRV